MMTNKRFAYVRVSTKDQHIDRQMDSLKKYITSDRDIFIDKQSGKDFNRPMYQALKAALRSGDELYIHSLDRLGRNKQGIKEELEYYRKEGVIIRCLDIPTTLIEFNSFGDFQRSIMEMVNNILIEVIGTIAEQERKTIRKRQAEGIQSAKLKGKHLGRPKAQITDLFIKVYDDWKAGNITAVEAMKRSQTTRCTFYKLAKKIQS